MTESSINTTLELQTFQMAGQEYSRNTKLVGDICGWTRTTPLPHAPADMKGVINLHGIVLPVIDRAHRLGLSPQELTDRNAVIEVNHNGMMTGTLVETVSGILALTADDLQPAPKLQLTSEMNVVSTLTLVEERMIPALDRHASVLQSQSSPA